MKIEIVCPSGYTAEVTYTRPPGIRIPFTDTYVNLELTDLIEYGSPAPPQKPIPKEWTTGITPEDAFKMCE